MVLKMAEHVLQMQMRISNIIRYRARKTEKKISRLCTKVRLYIIFNFYGLRYKISLSLARSQ